MSEAFPETARELRETLKARGLAPTKRFGQHFLIEPRLLDVIARLGELSPDDLVLEVGTGPGNLTRRLSDIVREVVTVEIDAGLYGLARDLLGHRPNIRLVHADVMATKTSLSPEVCERIQVALADSQVRAFKVVANLPYNVSTPFLSSLFVRFGPPDLMVLLVQKELARNLVAEPGSKDYSALTILFSLLTETRIERTLGRDIFWPKPQVDSSVVVSRARDGDATAAIRAYALVRHLFGERRKAISSALRKLPSEMGGPLGDRALAAVLEAVELEGKERAESLAPERFLALDRAVSRHAGRS
ncbi:MAG: 16S rRNA (adenine(1518)-N(6)/adenine(1519)-N(6))-dimethyltransferase RsmA [Planctomycetota bacterium]